MNLAVKASVWFVICGIFKNVIDVLFTPLFTRILTKEQYGIYNVYNSWFLIVNILFTLYLLGDIFNVGLVKYEKDRDRFISSTLGFVTTMIVAYLTLYLIFHDAVEKIVGLPWYLILVMFGHVLVNVPYYFWTRRERYDLHYRNVVVVSLIYIILQPVTSVISILCFDFPINPGYTRVIAAVGVQIIIGFILYVLLMSQGKRYFDKKYWKYSLKVGIELVPYNLSRIVLNQSDRIMINYFSGTGDTAIYSIAHSAAFVLQVVTDSLNGAFVPWLYRKMHMREWSGIKKITNGLLAMVAVCVFGIDIIAPEIMKILGSSEYFEGVYCIPALVFSVYLIFICNLFSNIEFFYEKNVYVTVVSTVGMIVNIVLNYIFIPKYGFVAAGYTTVVGFLVMCFGNYFLMKKCLKAENEKVSGLFDKNIFVAVSACLFGFTLVCSLLYRYNVIRWLFVIALAVIMLVTKNKWLKIIANLKDNNKEAAAEQ